MTTIIINENGSTGTSTGGASTTDLSVTHSGTLKQKPIFYIISPVGLSVGGEYYPPVAGKWIDTENIGLSTDALDLCAFLSFDDLTGVLGDFFWSGQNTTTKNAPELQVVTRGIGIDGASTYCDLHSLKAVGNYLYYLNSVQPTFSSIENIGGSLQITGCTGQISLPRLKYVGDGLTINANNDALSIDLDDCTIYGSAVVQIFNNPSVTSIKLGNVDITGALNINTLPAVTSIDVSKVVNCGDLYISGCDLVSALNFDSIKNIAGLIQDNDSGTMAGLTNLSLGSGLLSVGGSVSLTASALNQTSVDNLLVSLANLDGTNGTTSYNGLPVTITGSSAAPSAQGLAAKAILESRGCIVATN